MIDVVTGASGFIGRHLVRRLRSMGRRVRAVDIEPFFGEVDEEFRCDLRDPASARAAMSGADHVYALAATMGGIGFTGTQSTVFLRDNTRINLNSIEAAYDAGATRYLYASSACVYPAERPSASYSVPLSEDDALPANPPDAYGWEKLMGEQYCRFYHSEHGMNTRIARLDSVYGPGMHWQGGKEKVFSALARKIATAKVKGTRDVEVWGDGEQSRSMCYIDDCVDALVRLIQSSETRPINIGGTMLTTINTLAEEIARVAGIEIDLVHIAGPLGVRGRVLDVRRAQHSIGWVHTTSRMEGIRQMYDWIEGRVLFVP